MFRRRRSAEDFAEEIQAHLELEADTLRAEGLSEEEARRCARVQFGSVRGAQEQFYLKGRWQWLDRLIRDLRFGFTLDDEAKSAPVMVVSYNYWTRRFNRDPGALGTIVYVKGVPFTVIGVAAQGFEGTEPGRFMDFWIPLQNHIEFNVLGNTPLGMDTNGLVVFGLNPQSIHSEPQLVQFYEELQRRLRLLPGVESASIMQERIGSFWSNNSNVTVDGHDPDMGKRSSTLVRQNDIGPDFFHTLGVPIIAGREFTDADTGLYGTLAYRVSRRTAEIGVRMALGAGRGQVVWMILRDSLLLTAFGVVAGVPLAIFVGRALASSLYGVKPLDVFTYALAVVGVALVALGASASPASRAASIDPLKALRTE